MTPVMRPQDTFCHAFRMVSLERSPRKPVVFACSGCSSAGKRADDVARCLDERGDAEMSCLAGIGSGHPTFRRKIENREAWLVDGCPLHCALGVFEQAGLGAAVSRHIRLQDYGVKKDAPLDTGPNCDTLMNLVTNSIHRDV